MWQPMPVFPALGMLRQKDPKFEDSLKNGHLFCCCFGETGPQEAACTLASKCWIKGLNPTLVKRPSQ